MNQKQTVNRRRFLERSTAGMALAAAPMIVSRNVLGANDKITMGLIGAGGRGRGVMHDLVKQGADFIAISEIFAPAAQQALDVLEEGVKNHHDYRALLDRSDIDAVLIATPEHQHCVQLIDAVQAGKDVYCEKPMSNTIEEGYRTVQKVRETDRIVQIGMQRRSSETVMKTKKLIEDEIIGQIYMVKAWWNWSLSHKLNNSPLQSELDWNSFCHPKKNIRFEPMKYREWRYFWPFSGGNCTDQGTHLMDVVQWFMNSDPPQAAECFGGVYEMTGAETPDIFSAIYDYGSFMASWTLNYTNKYQSGWMIQFQGRKGTIMINDSGAKVYVDPWDEDTPPDYSMSYDAKPEIEIAGGIPTSPHTQNFLDCVKSRKEPNAPVEVGHSAVCGPHLANVAWHKKERAYLRSDLSGAY
ncbi:MAG: Gfo/Idh/MocA family oxidoreductase [Candidatus Omnitrophica bacterium]|nr:Gfo/Idh/MocA family oxidoreductase [Candidatus Omnitrophota bacterium]